MAFVSVGSNIKTITDLLGDCGVQELAHIDQDVLQKGNIVKVFINGNWFGIYDNADELLKNIKHMRRTYTIPKEVSVCLDITNREIRLLTDSGRVQRPLFIVENN
mmetsp:Transcript_27634/g.26655  ORF Transcript_27634/g.26655 Transcript_27634/m.26655 type:complete len:105 (+) Transcript_27634:756-1070(+)